MASVAMMLGGAINNAAATIMRNICLATAALKKAVFTFLGLAFFKYKAFYELTQNSKC